MDLTDDQWSIIQPLIHDPTRRPDGKGRSWKDARDVMNGILWILRTGACWYDMPDRYLPPYQICHRRFQQGVRTGRVFEKILQALSTDLRKRGGIDLSECYIDGGTFIVAKKERRTRLERLSGAKVRRSSWQYQIVLAFLSPYTLRLLRHKKSPLLMKQLSPPSVLSLLLKSQNV
jgi:transposase